MSIEDKLEHIDVSEKCIKQGTAILQHNFIESGNCCYLTTKFPEYMTCPYREIVPLQNGLYPCRYEENE